MIKMILVFSECEHDGDLQNYLTDVNDCDAHVLESKINYEAEIATVLIEIGDKKEFLDKFRLTDAYSFSQYG